LAGLATDSLAPDARLAGVWDNRVAAQRKFGIHFLTETLLDAIENKLL
jgi:hypothetical protein